jgi:phosphate:Na+ symporter
MIATVLGGIGLFLIGMLIMTEGLQAVAGDALRNILARFTRTRLMSVISGTLVTATVQSSSVTTLLTVGFVSAELLTFTSAIGVIYGANIGTTTTSWLVSMIGFKVKIDAFALPMVGLGALFRLFARGRKASFGMALAGFGLIFIGIDVLQSGMAGLSEAIDLQQYAADGIGGRMLLVIVGIVMTVILQSSSAAMATTLTALFAGAITLEQGAALCIGQAVGTTVTAAIAALGASVQAKRTALAHILFNVVTGVVAFMLLPLFIYLVDWWSSELSPGDQAVALSAFLTTFKFTGVVMFYPFTPQYAAWLERLLPDRSSTLTRRLNASSLAIPSIAIEAAHNTVREATVETFTLLRHVLDGRPLAESHNRRMAELIKSVDQTRAYLKDIHSDPNNEEQYARHVAVLHALDHIERLIRACEERDHRRYYREHENLLVLGETILPALEQAEAWFEDPTAPSPVGIWHRTSRSIAEHRRQHRKSMLDDAARGVIDPQRAVSLLETKRWIDRLAYHGWRVLHHLVHGEGFTSGDSAPETEMPISDDDEASHV